MGSPESVKNLTRGRKSIEKDSQQLEARLAVRIAADGSKFLVRKMEEEIAKINQNMEELLKSFSQSLRARSGHPNAYVEGREYQQTGQKWRECIDRARRSNETSAQFYCSTKTKHAG